MSAILDRTDVAQVEPEALALPVKHLIVDGRGLALVNGLTESDMRGLEHTIWDRLEGSSCEKAAVLLRFRALLAVLSTSRMRQKFLRSGLPLLGPALRVASVMRLNAQWGFNPVKFARALEACIAEHDERRPILRAPMHSAEPQLATA